jgi:hypothetical protein
MGTAKAAGAPHRSDGATRRLVVERVIGFKPGEKCGTVFVSAPLEDTPGGGGSRRPAVAPASTRRGSLCRRRIPRGRIRGCNRISGGYHAHGQQTLSFGPMAATQEGVRGVMESSRSSSRRVRRRVVRRGRPQSRAAGRHGNRRARWGR